MLKNIADEINRVTKLNEHLETGDYRLDRKCKVCGCTELNGCPNGCYWVEEDLCSNRRDKER